MPNSLIDAYRQQMAAAGAPDTRDDYFVMQDLIPLAQQNPHLLDQYPDFAKEYGQYRDANAPSLGGEFTRAFKAGSQEAGSTYAGLAALATGSEGAKQTARNLEADAAENAPTIGSMEDIAPGETGLSRLFSKDTARYVAGKLGGAIPSIGEMVGTGIAGAAVGLAIEPGVGTLAGAGEGVVEGLLDRGIIKSAIKSLLEEGVGTALEDAGVKDVTEQGVKDAILSGNQKAADLVTHQAKAIAAGRAEAGTNFANVYGMSAGGIYNETGDRGSAVGLGAAAALTAAPPFLSLPARVARSLFPKLSAEAAQDAAAKLVGDKTSQLLAKIGAPTGRVAGALTAGTVGVVGMEAANIVAKNIAAGKDAMDLDESDWKRLREAAVGGAIAAAPFAGLAAKSPTVAPDAVRPPEPPPDAQEPGTAQAAPVPAPQAATPPPTSTGPVPPSALDITRRVAAMSDDQKRSRLAELGQIPTRSPAEDTEFQQLTALTPKAKVVAPVVAPTPEATAEPTIAPNEPAPDETSTTPPPPEAAAVPPVQPPPQYLYSHQRPKVVGGRQIPGYTQIDEVINGENTRSTNLADLAKEGVTLPVPPEWLPTGNYTPEQVTAAISEGAPSVSIQDAGFRDDAHFAQEYAAGHDAESFETTDEYLKRIYCQSAA